MENSGHEWIGRAGLGAVLVAAAMIGIVGCAPNTMVATGSAQGVVTAVPSGTADPRVLAAVHTYEAFNRTLVEAQRHPVQPGRAYPTEADFSRYSFDPLRAENESAIAKLSLAGREFRGRPPTSQIIVTEIDLGAQIGPTVVLSDCRNGQKKWQEYEAASNTMVPADDNDAAAAATPHGLTVTVIFYHQRWGVQTIAADPSRACKG